MSDMVPTAQAEIVQVARQQQIATLDMDGYTKAQIDMQVSTAKAYPRQISNFTNEALSMATYNEDIAASCGYALPRGGKKIKGPSVRLAEICANAWGNLRVEASITDIGETHLTAKGIAWDVEKNVAYATEVRRRITNSSGDRYNDDMIITTGNAAIAIARRNAIFLAVPRPLAQMIYEQAMRVAVGDSKTIATRREKCVAYFQGLGVTVEEICASVEKRKIEDIDADALETLLGYSTSIKDGGVTVDDIFRAAKDGSSDDLADAIDGSAEKGAGDITEHARSKVKKGSK